MFAISVMWCENIFHYYRWQVTKRPFLLQRVPKFVIEGNTKFQLKVSNETEKFSHPHSEFCLRCSAPLVLNLHPFLLGCASPGRWLCSTDPSCADLSAFITPPLSAFLPGCRTRELGAWTCSLRMSFWCPGRLSKFLLSGDPLLPCHPRSQFCGSFSGHSSVLVSLTPPPLHWHSLARLPIISVCPERQS